MKYTVKGLQQKRLVELKLDLIDAEIIDWFVKFKDGGSMKTIIHDGKTWYWVKHQYLIDDLPIIGIKSRDALSRRLKRLVTAGIFEKHVVKSSGTYTYYRLNENGYYQLLRDPSTYQTAEHPTQKSCVSGTPDSKVVPNDTTQKSCDTRPKSRTKDTPTSDPSLSLIVAEASGNQKFTQAFNDFCVDDSVEYRKDKSYWIFSNAAKYKCSLGDVIDALEICCEKDKAGEMDYLTGILRKKAENREMGIRAFGKPEGIQIVEYLRQRLSGHMDIISNYDIDYDSKKIYYSIINNEDRDIIRKVLDDIVSVDVKNHTGVEMEFQMR